MKTVVAMLALAGFVLAAAGCATTLSTAAENVRVSDQSDVSGCTFLGTVQGSSGFGNLAASTGMHNARVEAQDKAAEMGATNIVWKNIHGGYSPYAVANAYRCPR